MIDVTDATQYLPKCVIKPPTIVPGDILGNLKANLVPGVEDLMPQFVKSPPPNGRVGA